ncbi:hypothetical protein FKB36_05900 [Methanoculleus sp. Afa-1]|uniref:Uncharacterized protein n=1 Tax=Methanoculleus formosensis TaxID=2590886 RepID=A0A9E4ZJF4_9EURY|nr:hypothetical protein [Methanoculleus sp. Afa-1]MCT8337040.1 hypothetical protein [Methanoculleus sp. Afa-1]
MGCTAGGSVDVTVGTGVGIVVVGAVGSSGIVPVGAAVGVAVGIVGGCMGVAVGTIGGWTTGSRGPTTGGRMGVGVGVGGSGGAITSVRSGCTGLMICAETSPVAQITAMTTIAAVITRRNASLIGLTFFLAGSRLE